jgi:centromere-localized protein 2
MPPTESQILSTFLLPPSSLRSLISLKTFTNLFPQPQRKNPQIPYLYRELHHQRGLVVDQITRNIAEEVKSGEAQRREVVKARRRDEREELKLLGEHDKDERDMEVAVCLRIATTARDRRLIPTALRPNVQPPHTQIPHPQVHHPRNGGRGHRP